MKILFKQKQWIAMQGIFVIVGMTTGIIVRTIFRKPVGGLAVSFHFISNTTEYTIPILFIILSDLAFNVEYAQGTFLTHLTCAQSRRAWMLKKSLNFYFFVLLQFFITFALVSLAAGIITGHFGLQGIDPTTLQNIKISEMLREGFLTVSLSILRVLVFVAFGVLVTTLLPGRFLVGSIASIGVIFILAKITTLLAHTSFGKREVISRIIDIIWMQNLKSIWSWAFGVLSLVIFTWLTIERVKRIEIASRGA
jgi:hypothetical protein